MILKDLVKFNYHDKCKYLIGVRKKLGLGLNNFALALGINTKTVYRFHDIAKKKICHEEHSINKRILLAAINLEEVFDNKPDVIVTVEVIENMPLDELLKVRDLMNKFSNDLGCKVLMRFQGTTSDISLIT